MPATQQQQRLIGLESRLGLGIPPPPPPTPPHPFFQPHCPLGKQQSQPNPFLERFLFPLYGNTWFCFIISVVCQKKGKLGKALTVLADAAGLFCCNETAALFKQAVHEPILVYNGLAKAYLGA